ncbi:MAG: transcriptional regulator [Streptococcus gallolyticus]|uniref:Transcriptional regulator n=1 Tax=Streptococcus gallolyticus TaxID=315405 RepID=A0A927XHT0_9STRE|nr:transcriptional regulator [Streptococcus gallolyticus]
MLSKANIVLLDSILSNYRHIPGRIARRKLEIETEHDPTDINRQVTKTNQINRRTEWLVTQFDSDIRIKSLENQQKAVENTLSTLDDDLKDLFYLHWVRGLSEDEIADLQGISKKSLNKKIVRILEIFAFEMGITS